MSIVYDLYCAYAHALTGYIAHLGLMLLVSGYRSVVKFKRNYIS
jgi:hypothetical protein